MDFADVRTVMQSRGPALMGTGFGRGENRAVEAAQEAISSPLLDNVTIKGAAGVLINITGGMDLTIDEVTTIASIIQEAAGDEAEIIFGAVHDRGPRRRSSRHRDRDRAGAGRGLRKARQGDPPGILRSVHSSQRAAAGSCRRRDGRFSQTKSCRGQCRGHYSTGSGVPRADAVSAIAASPDRAAAIDRPGHSDVYPATDGLSREAAFSGSARSNNRKFAPEVWSRGARCRVPKPCF